jgi:hypothetical protein
MRYWPIAALLAVALAAALPAQAQHAHDQAAVTPGTDMVPTEPGQAAFGTVQEIVRILRADPATDWSKVDLDRLRTHLIDMDEVTMRAHAAVRRIDGGIEAIVTGQGRTLAAIQRMLPAHAAEIDGQNMWHAVARSRPDGVVLVVTSAVPEQAQMIQGLGFIGVMATGAHHQMHHLAMARGTFAHGDR